MIPDGPASFEWMESGDLVTSGEEKSFGNSVFGVGGVMVVWGCGIEVCGGVLGAGMSKEGKGLSSLRSVRMGAGNGGGASAIVGALFADTLPRRLLFVLDVDPARSRLTFFLSGFEPKAFLKRRPGEMPRFFPLRSDGTLNVEPCWLGGRETSVSC